MSQSLGDSGVSWAATLATDGLSLAGRRGSMPRLPAPRRGAYQKLAAAIKLRDRSLAD